jgi:pimeloyl-ACP methyl ester carboxylesterase
MTKSWNGYSRADFMVDGRQGLLVAPQTARAGRPWIWRTEFFDAFPMADRALLGLGFHVAYVDVQNLYGAPMALDAMDRFYDHLLQVHALAPRVVLEGFSRGGLFAFNWAVRHPERVVSLYVDAPVCDFKSWPAGRGRGPGSPEDWARCLTAYGLTEAEALAYGGNPIDRLAPLAAARVPILAVCGDADELVPMEENTKIVEERYRALGGEIKVMVKPGCGHHPHSLQDPAPITDFILARMIST